MTRAQVDAVAIGSGTLLADDPLLTCRHVFRERPLIRVILDRALRTPATARLLKTTADGPVLIVTSPAALARSSGHWRRLQHAGAVLLPVNASSLLAALREVARHDVQSILLEGGAIVHQAAWDEGLVDYVQLYIAPTTIGGSGPRLSGPSGSILAALSDIRVRQLGPDALIEGYVHRSH
jgi:diaminohydroxyphosphoribosylaminopyrimidine deaminase/5-amino-6-(5-phosphoribosylamino)uracil reductase